MELSKVNSTDEPTIGSNVTLICRTFYTSSISKRPVWAYWIITNESMQLIDETNPPRGNNFMQIQYLILSSDLCTCSHVYSKHKVS